MTRARLRLTLAAFIRVAALVCALALPLSSGAPLAAAAAPAKASAAKKCHVPNVVGKTLPKAKAKLRAAGCKVGSISRKSSSRVAEGKVISTRPPAGRTRPGGTRVNLTLSTGRAATCTVPNVVGKSLSAAKKQIKQAGCRIGKITRKSSATVPKGDVISQKPAAGTVVPKGTKVNLVVSTGPGYPVPKA